MTEPTEASRRDEPLEKKWKREVRELEAAGWEKLERMGKIVWRRPESGYLYPQDVAIRMVREALKNGRMNDRNPTRQGR